MFDKLLSRLSYTPSHLEEFILYSRRLQKEKSIRRLTTYLFAFGAVLLIFSLLNPTEKSRQYSDDNIINGIQTKSDILTQWDNRQSDISKIYNKFGVTRQDIANLPDKPNVSINTSDSGNYWTILRHLDEYSLTEAHSTERGFNVLIGNKIVYMQPLDSISTTPKKINAFKGRNSATGLPFWILAETGGYVQVGKKIAREEIQKPQIVVKKTYIPSSAGQNGAEFVYEYRNVIPDSLAQNVQINDQIDPSLFGSLETSDNVTFDSGGSLRINLADVRYEPNSRRVVVHLKSDKSPVSAGGICSAFSVSTSNSGLLNTQNATNSCEIASEGIKTDQEELSPPSISQKAAILVGQDKQSNISANAVSAGDVVEYKLTIQNTSDKTIPSITLPYYIGDLLDYANVHTDELAAQNADLQPSSNEILWNVGDLAAKSQITKSFKLYIKDPLPRTNRPSVFNFTYDCRIASQNGNTLSLPVICPAVKKLENIPSISGISALLITAAALSLSVFFYARARILETEARRIKKKYQQQHNG